MPAIEHHFLEQLPRELYLDTDIAVSYLARNQPHHPRCVSLIDRIVRDVNITAYISTLSWMEFAQVVSREGFRRNLPNEMSLRLQAGAWESRAARRVYMQAFEAYFKQFLDQLDWVEVHLTPDVRELALDLMADYALGSQDAVHLASASLAGVQNIVSFDESFRRVDGLHLWNDLIHVRPRA